MPLTAEDTPVAELGQGEILVRNEYTTLCRSDVNTYTGKRIEKTPTILGHEIVGCIEALGPNAPKIDCRGELLKVGDRITWAIFASDPDSELARMGIPQKGGGLFKYGHEKCEPHSTLHGGLSEYCILRKNTPIIRLSPEIPLPVAALINCSVATVAGSVRLAGSLNQGNLLIAGAGMLGLVACAMLSQLSNTKVIVLDIDDDRLEMAKRFGAGTTIKLDLNDPAGKQNFLEALGNQPVQLAMDYSGVPETMELLVASLAVGGTAVFVGATYPQRHIQLSAEYIVRNLLTIRGLHNYNQSDFVTAVQFMEKHHASYPFLDLIEDKFDLDTVNLAFETAAGTAAHRVGLRILSQYDSER